MSDKTITPFVQKPTVCSCLFPVRRFPRPSRCIHFGDVFVANERKTASLVRLDDVTRNALATWNNDAQYEAGELVLICAILLRHSHWYCLKYCSNIATGTVCNISPR